MNLRGFPQLEPRRGEELGAASAGLKPWRAVNHSARTEECSMCRLESAQRIFTERRVSMRKTRAEEVVMRKSLWARLFKRILCHSSPPSFTQYSPPEPEDVRGRLQHVHLLFVMKVIEWQTIIGLSICHKFDFLCVQAHGTQVPLGSFKLLFRRWESFGGLPMFLKC